VSKSTPLFVLQQATCYHKEMQFKGVLLEVIGGYGMITIIGAYFLNSFGFISADNIWYQLMNLTGGATFIYYTLAKRAWASLVVNSVWTIIAATSLWRMFM
jgi:hypothetical protein